MPHFQHYTVASFFTAFTVQCLPLSVDTLHIYWTLPFALDSIAGSLWANYLPAGLDADSLAMSVLSFSNSAATSCNAECGHLMIERSKKMTIFLCNFIHFLWNECYDNIWSNLSILILNLLQSITEAGFSLSRAPVKPRTSTMASSCVVFSTYTSHTFLHFMARS